MYAEEVVAVEDRLFFTQSNAMAIRRGTRCFGPAREEDVFVYRARRRCKVVWGGGKPLAQIWPEPKGTRFSRSQNGMYARNMQACVRGQSNNEMQTTGSGE